MIDASKFFVALRSGPLFSGVLDAPVVAGCNVLLIALAKEPAAYIAYALATVYKETWHTMQPIEEKGNNAYFFRMYDPQGNRPDVARELGNTQPGDGVRYHGRGYVQLTGRALYAKASEHVGVDLINAPQDALQSSLAAQIMQEGMSSGWFTGRSLGAYLPFVGRASFDAFVQARRVINGQDCAAEIAGYAMQFQEYLT